MTALAVTLAHVHPAWEDFGPLEWTLTGLAALFVAWSIWKAVAYTMYPGEEEPEHPKRIIFGGPAAEPRVSSTPTGDDEAGS